MGRYLDPISQSKQDWFTHVEKQKQAAKDRQLDAENNKRIADKKAAKLENPPK